MNKEKNDITGFCFHEEHVYTSGAYRNDHLQADISAESILYNA